MPARLCLRLGTNWFQGLLMLALWLAVPVLCPGQTEPAGLKAFLKGDYEDCIRQCERAASYDPSSEDWAELHVRALLAVGRYAQAETVVTNALARLPASIRLRWQGHTTARFTGQPDLAAARLEEINRLFGARNWAYREPPDVIALGRMAVELGADPKTILERLYNVAQRAAPDYRESYLATGDLALSKNDYALAARTFNEALKKFPDDPEVLYGLARSYQPNNRGRMLELLSQVLEKNPNHVPSLLLMVDHAVDAEEYTQADKLLTQALKVNPWDPEAWAYRGVLAHLRSDKAGEAVARANGLKFWPTNPEVDYLIGLKLSQNYRFAEGAEYQRRARAFDPAYLPAQIQLAQDLLRLGGDEGWALAAAVHAVDGYDVTAFNLTTLQRTMQSFRTLTNADFVLRMGANEAALYGDRALALLDRARSNLTAKYGVTLESPTYVEIFPEQKDFAVRTFGMPHNPGFLGVCFGRVVTANSPASQGGNPSSWEAVLWHEFCHVVTLQMTKNKMPRWLSEGISVYEELQANPAWGQTMNPRYREMVLGEDLKPVSDLSSAFMSPKSDLHVQFAYYESALVVEFLVNRYGFDNLKAILRDLALGVNINDAIPKHTAPMNQIEKEFAAFARAKAEALGPGLDWTKPETESSLLSQLLPGRRRGASSAPEPSAPVPTLTVTGTNSAADGSHPTVATTNATPVSPEAVAVSGKSNYWQLVETAARLINAKNWEAAKAPLMTLISLYPNQTGPNSAYAMLAAVYRNLNETQEERAALEKVAAAEADVPDAYLRLMEIAEATNDWPTVMLNAERFLGVNPLLPQPYRHLARAGEGLGRTNTAIGAYEKLLLLDPADPAEVHFRLAQLLRDRDAAAAKRHVLQALEEAPRYRAAHRLLLELAGTTGSPTSPMPTQIK